MSKWNTEKQFSSFLGLSPNNRISGGKVLRRSTRKVYNRAADTLGSCAQSLTHSKSALEAKYRRLRARLGAPKAIVAMAHHLARLVYRMLLVCCATERVRSKKASNIMSASSASSALNGSKRKPVSSTSNSLPPSCFRHQFLERELLRR